MKEKISLQLIGVVLVTSLTGSVGGRLFDIFVNSDTTHAQIRNGIEAEINNRIVPMDTSLKLLCNDYSQTIYRMDQNIQNLGDAMKVKITRGQANLDVCKIK